MCLRGIPQWLCGALIIAWHQQFMKLPCLDLQLFSKQHMSDCTLQNCLLSTHQIHKMVVTPEHWHFRTDRIFVHRFLPSKEEPGISFSQIHTTTMLFSILKCLNSMLPITHPRPLLRIRHFYEFGVLHRANGWQIFPPGNVMYCRIFLLNPL